MTSALQHRQALVVYTGVVVTSLGAGLLVARSQQALALWLLALLTLIGLVLVLNLPRQTVFLSWLFLSPLFQNPADATSLGRALVWALYIAPALLLVVLTVAERRRVLRASPLDWLPGAYVAYVLVSILLTSDALQTDPTGSMKAIFTIVAIGPIVYYFLTLGPGVEIPVKGILTVLLVAAVLQGVFAVLEMAIGWTLWGQTGWQQVQGGIRATATLANPGVLGMLLGAGIVTAVAILTWGGPRALRRPAWVVLGACTPGLLLTLTRGPVLATAVAVVLVLFFGRARLAGMAVLAVSILTTVILLPSIQKTAIYQERLTKSSTVELRVAIQDVSLHLAAEKPGLGWGYGSFDERKNASGLIVQGIPLASVLETTSHNTYLTVLVELGLVGLVLYIAPFLVLGVRTLRLRLRLPEEERWVLASTLGSLGVIYITAATLDFRFFSFAQMLPFVFLAILRRLAAEVTPSGPGVLAPSWPQLRA